MADEADDVSVIADGELEAPAGVDPLYIASREDIEMSAAAGGHDILASVALAPRNVVADPRQPPWNAVVLLAFFRNQLQVAHATGFLIKRDVVLTAAHNLEIAFDSIGVYPGYHPSLNRVPSLTVKARARHTQRDVAVLIVDPVQHSIMRIGDNGPPSIILAGYSTQDASGNPLMTSGTSNYTQAGNVGSYAIDVRRGDSGSPVFVNTIGGPNAVAVHSAMRDLGVGLVGVGMSAGPNLTAIIAQLESAARERITGG